MHPEIQGQIEYLLAGKMSGEGFIPGVSSSVTVPRSISEHLTQCSECRQEVAAMQSHSELMREFRAAGQVPEPRPGFYARVMERIEAEGPVSIWNLFMESAFGRRIAYASVALALVLGVYLVSSERNEEPIMADQSVTVPLSQDVSTEQGAINDVTPVSSASFGAAADGDIATQMLQQQQMMMQQMINQMDDAASEDQLLVNLATYQEQ